MKPVDTSTVPTGLSEHYAININDFQLIVSPKQRVRKRAWKVPINDYPIHINIELGSARTAPLKRLCIQRILIIVNPFIKAYDYLTPRIPLTYSVNNRYCVCYLTNCPASGLEY